MRGFLGQRPIGFVYGSLASGADIVVAEAFLEAGVELNIVLPFAVEEFVAISVAPAGAGWVERFHSCLSRATAVIVTSDSSYRGVRRAVRLRRAYRHGARTELRSVPGRTRRTTRRVGWRGIVRARRHRTRHRRVGVAPVDPTHVVAVPRVESGRGNLSTGARRPGRSAPFCSPTFGASAGLVDEQFPAFLDQALSRLATVLARHAPGVLWCNTQGDGIAAILH